MFVWKEMEGRDGKWKENKWKEGQLLFFHLCIGSDEKWKAFFSFSSFFSFNSANILPSKCTLNVYLKENGNYSY